MVVYVDTSVIISAIDKGDHRCKDADKFLRREKEKIISPLVLAEIYSVVSRNSERINLGFNVAEEDLPAVLARLCMRKYNLKLICISDKEFSIFGEIPTKYKLAFMLAPKLKLRTLDLLHISYAWAIKLNGYDVKEFVTLDRGILDTAEKIEEITDIRVIEP